MKHKLLTRLVTFCTVGILGLSAQIATAQVSGNPVLSHPEKATSKPVKGKVDAGLLALEESYVSSARLRSARTAFESNNFLLQIHGNKVVVDVIAKTDVAALKAELEAKGMDVKATFGKIISGWLPIEAISELENLGSLQYVMPAYKPWKNVGSTTSQGDSAMRSTVAKRTYGVDGLGVKIGVLSDSYDNLGGAATGVLKGDLPGPGNPNNYTKPVQVLSDLSAGGSDEGRAMIELIHDVAPGSELAFHTAFNGQADFAQGIIRLANSGCKVITDDVYYFAEPFFQDGIIAQAVDIVKAQGVSYFSAAGNQGRASYESDFRNTNTSPLGADLGEAHNFGPYSNPPVYFQPIFIPKGGTFICSFQWDEPFFSASASDARAKTDLDIYLLNDNGAIVAVGGSDNIRRGDPIEVFGYLNSRADTTTSETFFLYIVKYAGPNPNRIKYVNFGDGAFYLTNPPIPGILSSTLTGHANASGAIAVGAAAFFNTPAFGVTPARINSFSSLGGTPVFFDGQGQYIGYEVRKKPEITAVDGTNTSFFEPFGDGDIPQDNDTLPNFFGTSAAAPHAAAVAALMIESSLSPNGLSPDYVKGTLAYTAIDMDDPVTAGFDNGFDYRTGNGFINAEAAVRTVAITPNYISSLNLTSVCSDDPDSLRRWRIHNPNPFNVRVNWEVYKTKQKGAVIAPPGNSFFFTTTVAGPNTTIISWKDASGKVKRNTKASSGAACNAARTGDELLTDNTSGFQVLSAFPNPSDGRFSLLFLGTPESMIQVKMYDMKGQQIYNRQHILEKNNSQLSIDASRFPAGLYMVQVAQGQKQQTLKIIKE